MNLKVNENNICEICPRICGVPRNEYDGFGYCGCGTLPKIARAAAHFGEEPCISGTKGSGTVFFAGCNLGCVYCQNREISHGGKGKIVDLPRLRQIFMELQSQGVHNINLVTGSHYVPAIVEALGDIELNIPVAWNSSGYDSLDSLAILDGKVQIYMPDFKYAFSDAALKYSSAADYPETAKAAILEMYRQVGPFVLDDDEIMKSGLLIRHLMLPNQLENTLEIIDWVSETFPPGSIMFSLMSQFTPLVDSETYPEIARCITTEEYEIAKEHLLNSDIEAGFFQDPESATDEYIPDFDNTGV